MRRRDDLLWVLADHQRRYAGGVALCREDPRVRAAAGADVGDVDAGRAQPRMGSGDVGHTPGEAPQAVRPVADPDFQIMRHLDDEIAAAEEEEPRTPRRLAAVEAQAEPPAAGVEGDGPFGVG